MEPIIGLALMLIRNVRINLGRRNICVAQERLYRSRIGAVLHQVRGKAMPQRVWRNVGHAGGGRMFLDY